MIAFLNGILSGKTLSAAFVDVGGVGYLVNMSQSAIAKLPEIGSNIQIRTYLQVSDSGVALYGFLNEEEKTLFEKLIGVSGVGPKMALAALSTFTPRALADAVASQDTALISKIPGVGKKTASRIVLELKGSLDEGIISLFQENPDRSILGDRMNGAMEALLSMGFTSAEVDLALKGSPEGATEQALIKYALKRIGS